MKRIPDELIPFDLLMINRIPDKFYRNKFIILKVIKKKLSI